MRMAKALLKHCIGWWTHQGSGSNCFCHRMMVATVHLDTDSGSLPQIPVPPKSLSGDVLVESNEHHAFRAGSQLLCDSSGVMAGLLAEMTTSDLRIPLDCSDDELHKLLQVCDGISSCAQVH